MHLYGVRHGGRRCDLFGRAEDVFVHPSIGLEQAIRTLPRRSKIGIETLPPEYREGVYLHSGLWVPFDQPSTAYFKELEDLATDCNLSLAYLDDLETVSKYVEKAYEARMDFAASNSLKEGADLRDDITEEDAQNLLRIASERRRSGFLEEIEARYIHEIEREERIMENLIAAQPDVAIVGIAHGEYFFSRRISLGRIGLDIYRYSREHVPNELPIGVRHMQAELQQATTPQLDLIAGRYRTIRLHNAAKQGRIVPEKQPDFIGTFNMIYPPDGLFEVYVTKRDGSRVSGIIEDTYGRAFFRGFINCGGVEFVKRYCPAAIAAGGTAEDIFYIGVADGDVVRGNFNFSGMENNFIMQKGDVLTVTH